MLRKLAIGALKVALAVAVLALLYLVLRGIGFRSIWSEMRRVRGRTIAAAALLVFTCMGLWAFRMHQLMCPERRPTLPRLFPLYMSGVFGNLVTPGARMGGEPIRALFMSRAFGGEKSSYLGTILADKVGNVVVVLGFLVASLAFLILMVPMALALRLLLVGAALVIVAAVVSGTLLREHVDARSPLLKRLLPRIYNAPPLGLLRRRFATYQHFEDYAVRKLDNVLSPILRASGSPRVLAKIILITTGAWLLYCLAHYVLFLELGAEIGFVRVIVIVTISTVVGDLSMSPGGTGLLETAAIGLCAAFGVDYETAAAAILISRGIYYGLGVGGGGLCLAAVALIYRRPHPARVDGQGTQASR